MNQPGPTSTNLPVALVCGEPRLRRILRLALEAGGYQVLDYAADGAGSAAAEPIAMVIDLDSLHRCVPAAARRGALVVPDRVPALLISVYPAAPEDEPREGPTDYLQPPFPGDEVVCRLGRLLSAAAGVSATGAADRSVCEGA